MNAPPLLQAATLTDLIRQRIALRSADPALHFFEDGQWQTLRWADLADQVRQAVAALTTLGIGPKSRVGLLAENCRQWIVLDFALHLQGGTLVPFSTALAPAQFARQLADAAPQCLFVGRSEMTKLDSLAANLPNDLRRASLSGAAPPEKNLLDWPRLVQQAAPAELSLDNEVDPDRLATILYTSGTQGEPKGIMLSQRNLAANAQSVVEAFGPGHGNLRVAWLPFAHIYARTCDLYVWLARGTQMALARGRDTILADCQTHRPHFINGVPYFYEKVMRHLQQSGTADQPGELRRILGGAINLCSSGGAPLPVHVAQFYRERGIPLVQGYGLTEASPVLTAATQRADRLGSVGPAVPGVELKIAADGEILAHGPNLMLGYWNQPQATAEAIQGGWLHTGDLGRLEEGYLFITGRKKELIVLSQGRKVAPLMLELQLQSDPLIAQAMIVGEGQTSLAALIVPDRDALISMARSHGLALTSPQMAVANPQVRQWYAEAIAARLASFAPHEQVRRFALLPRGFTLESGELTPTLKLRRAAVLQNFSQEIAQLFS